MEFKQKIIDSGIVDGEGLHHVFNQGSHGQKIDFDLIDDNSELYDNWVELTAEFIKENYDKMPDVVVGVANGTNRLAISVAEVLGENVEGIVTEKKEGSKRPVLGDEAAERVRAAEPKMVLVLEDVGTTGTSSFSVCESLKDSGAESIEVLNTWQRNDGLKRLDEEAVKYKSVIKEVLPSYPPEECEKSGFCAKGWKLIGHGQ